MPSNESYRAYIMEQCGSPQLTSRKMMGEYILYYKGRIVGGIYDDRLLVKPVPAAMAMMPQAAHEVPYEGAKPMLLVEDVDSPGFIGRLFEAMLPELPIKKERKTK